MQHFTKYQFSIAALVAALVLSVGLTACGSTSSNGGSADNSSVDNGSASAGSTNGSCVTENRHFAKTRFAVNLGLAAGAFHRYIYKSMKSGGFQAGAEKRKRTIAKAVLAGAFAVKQLNDARKLIKSDEKLCKYAGAFSSFDDKIGALKDKLKAKAQSGDTNLDDLKSDAQSAEQPLHDMQQNLRIPDGAVPSF